MPKAMNIQKTRPKSGVNNSIKRLINVELEEEAECADDDCEKGDTFDECGDDNHVASDIASCFGLTGDGIHGRATDFTDTDTCADCCELRQYLRQVLQVLLLLRVQT